MYKTLAIFSILALFLLFAAQPVLAEEGGTGTASHHYFYNGSTQMYKEGPSSGSSYHYYYNGTEPYVKSDRGSGEWGHHYFYPGNDQNTQGSMSQGKMSEGMETAITNEDGSVARDNAAMTGGSMAMESDSSRLHHNYYYRGGEYEYVSPIAPTHELKEGNWHYFYTGAEPFASSKEMMEGSGHWGHNYYFPW